MSLFDAKSESLKTSASVFDHLSRCAEFHGLSESQLAIAAVLSDVPERGAVIAERSGYQHQTVRRQLPALVRNEIATKVPRGYVRGPKLHETLKSNGLHSNG